MLSFSKEDALALLIFRLEIKMNIKSLLLGSAAALAAVTGARAAAAVTVAEPEPAEYVVTGEPNDVRLKNVDGQWSVQVVENGKVTRHLFNAQAVAESYAEFQRNRLGLPGKPPIWEENPVDERPKREIPDFIINDVLDLAEYSDLGIVTTLVDTHGVRLRLHLTT
ncbi:hypothetical protein [Mesorhizobium sp. M0678]|uniref:hypothetical protein n=1 Tax=Mesorhizobium sp. M0678 TaxID=2956985 RepID=UPI00333D23B1